MANWKLKTTRANANYFRQWSENPSTLKEPSTYVVFNSVYKYTISSHASHKIDFIISTDYHPCNGRTCPFYGVCQAPTKTTHICVCIPCTTDESAPLCDTNDVTHKNKCEYNYHVCQAQEEPGIKHYGGCKRKSCLLLCPWISCRIISRIKKA